MAAVWQYAQLTITIDAHDRDQTRTVLWHGPGQEVQESDSQMSLLELLNKVGADGWELTSQEEQRAAAEGPGYWDVPWSLNTYTFKRRVPG
jgi:hypothetical protein